MFPRLRLILFLSLVMVSCGVAGRVDSPGNDAPLETTVGSGDGAARPDSIPDADIRHADIRHAVGFNIIFHDSWTQLDVRQPWPGATGGLSYALVPRGTEINRAGTRELPANTVIPADALIIETPIRSLVTMSASFLAPLAMLGVTDTWVGHDQLSRVYAPWARQRILEGQVRRVGEGSQVDLELLLDLEPDLVMINQYEPGAGTAGRLVEAGLAAMVNADWLESTPLGRAEWIKVFGLLYNRWDHAGELFAEVEREYLRLAALPRQKVEVPTVLTNAPFRSIWSVPAGQSYTAVLLRDAGADYLWSHTPGTGALHLDIEQVFATAADADLWLNPGAWSNLRDGMREDERLARFAAFARGDVFNFDNRLGSNGGNDFFETAPYAPHLVLADLIRIIHADLLPNHQLYYYRRVSP